MNTDLPEESTDDLKIDYKDTLNLPQTAFPMKANLKVREAQMLESWKNEDLYKKIREKGKGKVKFIMHDGPPYANGNIHIGTSLNKILKDFVVKIKTMEGFDAPYVPGWDCHGLPIELHVEKELGKKKNELTKSEIRKLCREYANKYVNIQREQFERLGVFADWFKPYLTMNYSYEATTVRELGKFIENGALYKGLKPIHWCFSCRTALAEAEVEYADHKSPSIYVKFKLKKDGNLDKIDAFSGTEASIVIWTTTPWTIPANLAVCVNPSFNYSIVKVGNETLVIATELVESVMSTSNIESYETITELTGDKFEGLKYLQPLTNEECPVILGGHVTLEQGTGCVHTAPGHGEDDYKIGLKNGLRVYNPVDNNGKFIDEVKDFAGMKVFAANPLINEKLKELNLLLHQGEIKHSYPHCWRCRKPIIFRATAQWFISMEKNDLRKKALNEIKSSQWVPAWGVKRIYNMIENRPDWCVSRQRAWGVPIIAFYCMECKEIITSKEIADRVATFVETDGADVWFEKTSNELLPEGFKCPKCSATEFEKETDILDVWFDSGVSHAAVMSKHEDLSWPADLYLEGSDQHRGWFHSSLLSSVSTRGKAPYKTVLTHGYVVDGKGKKMSKSAGNVIAPQKIIDRYGAEILRLWVSSENYKEDIRISDEILKRLTDAYRKMRNTFRFMLGNLKEFDVTADRVDYNDLLDIDKFILHKLQGLVKKIRTGYDNYEYHLFYHTFHNFCTVDLSAFYLDIIKDRLYTFKEGSLGRRACQTVIYEILTTMLKLAAPILSFTTEEIWTYVKDLDSDVEDSIHFAKMPEVKDDLLNDILASKWETLIELRTEVSRALEIKRRDKFIGHSLDAHVLISISGKYGEVLKEYKDELNFIFITSQASIVNGAKVEGDEVFVSDVIEGLRVKVNKADGEKCERCWNYSVTVGNNNSHKTVCERCIENINS